VQLIKRMRSRKRRSHFRAHAGLPCSVPVPGRQSVGAGNVEMEFWTPSGTAVGKSKGYRRASRNGLQLLMYCSPPFLKWTLISLSRAGSTDGHLFQEILNEKRHLGDHQALIIHSLGPRRLPHSA